MLIGLTVLTGVVDAVSYLALGRVFVANMTGNVVFLGFAIAGAGGLSAVTSLFALGAFLLGAVAGRRVVARRGEHRGHLLRTGAGLEASLIVVALLVALISSAPEPSAVRYAIVVLLALGMGMQNALAGRLAVPELTTTVLTKTLTGLAAESHAGAAALLRRFAAVTAMLLGALAGALLVLHASVPWALAAATALACALAAAAHLASRREGAWTRSS